MTRATVVEALHEVEAIGAKAIERAYRPYPEYRDTSIEWLGCVPAHWQSKRLKYAVSLINEKIDGNTSDLPYVGLENIKSWTGQRLDAERVESDGVANRFRPGDVLFGKLRPYLAKVHHALEDGFCTSEALVLRPRLLDAQYLFYYAIARDFIDVVDGSTFGSKMPRADWQFIGNLPSLLPPLPEQRAIAVFLDRKTRQIDELIAKKRRLIELLQEKRIALISHAVTKGLNPSAPPRPSGIDWLGDVPADVLRLKFLSSFVTSGSRGWAEFYSQDGEVFLRIGNVSRGGIDLDLFDIQRVTPPSGAEGERTVVRGGDVLISVTAYIGAVGVVPGGFERAYVNQHLALVRPRLDLIEPRYLAYALFSSVGQMQFRQLMYGGTKEGLGLDDVKNLQVIVRSLTEQRAIVTYLDAIAGRIGALIAAAENAIARLNEYRQALISAAVTGKVDVREEAE